MARCNVYSINLTNRFGRPRPDQRGYLGNPMGNATQDIVVKLWNLCNILRGDGVTYHQYVTELTYLLFLKMAKETETEGQLPKGYRWDDVERESPPKRLQFYKLMLIHLGTT